MKITRSHEPGARSEQRSDTFTGLVFGDPVIQGVDGVAVNNVFFGPGARTHWHTHERGQILHVTSGQGRICTRDGESGVLGVGDTVYIPPDEEHWHGADADTYLVHLAISLGETRWLDAVSDDDYARAG